MPRASIRAPNTASADIRSKPAVDAKTAASPAQLIHEYSTELQKIVAKAQEEIETAAKAAMAQVKAAERARATALADAQKLCQQLGAASDRIALLSTRCDMAKSAVASARQQAAAEGQAASACYASFSTTCHPQSHTTCSHTPTPIALLLTETQFQSQIKADLDQLVAKLHQCK